MGFWDKVKTIFGGSSDEDEPGQERVAAPLFDERGLPTPRLLARVERRIRKRAAKQHLFTRHDIARAVLAKVQGAPPHAATLAANAVIKLKVSGLFDELDYECTYALGANDEVFHPRGTDPEGYPGEGGGAAVSRGRKQPAQEGTPPPRTAPTRGSPYRSAQSPYDSGQKLGMSAAELRQRGLQIDPWSSPWMNRFDVIPPASDERTALIDRGLVLRGYMSEAEVQEAHRLGDLWLEHKHKALMVELRARRAAKDAATLLDREAAQRKIQKRRDAAARREARAESVARRRAEEIVFLGRGFSGKLGDCKSDLEALERAGLPLLSTPGQLATALEVSVPTLRWLAFHSEAAELAHYVQFEVAKKTGGIRLLAAPLPRLAAAQRWILKNVLEKVAATPAAHGFVPGRSTVSNAAAHVRRDVVINIDLKSFFPSIHFPRVRGIFEAMGYSPAVATVMAMLTTEAPRRRVHYDGKPYWVAVGPRALPQGAATSPALSNLAAHKLDRRLIGMAAKHDLHFTRYADDLTLSLAAGRRDDIGMVLARVRHIVEDEGFTVHPDKVRVQRAGGRQSVTGIVVNHGLAVPREEIRRLRAILHLAKSTGLEAQNRDGIADFRAHIRGKIAYVTMVDRAKGEALRRVLDACA